MVNLYNSEGYLSPMEYEVFTRLERQEKAARKSTTFRPIVYICSLYSSNTISNGMKAEINRAKRKHMKIRYFTEELEEKQ